MYILKYHKIDKETPKAYQVVFNLKTRIPQNFAVAIDLGNCSRYPMWTSDADFNKSPLINSSKFVKENNLFAITCETDFKIWFGKGAVQIRKSSNLIKIPDWLIKKIANNVYIDLKYIVPERGHIYPNNTKLMFAHMLPLFTAGFRSDNEEEELEPEPERHGILMEPGMQINDDLFSMVMNGVRPVVPTFWEQMIHTPLTPVAWYGPTTVIDTADTETSNNGTFSTED